MGFNGIQFDWIGSNGIWLFLFVATMIVHFFDLRPRSATLRTSSNLTWMWSSFVSVSSVCVVPAALCRQAQRARCSLPIFFTTFYATLRTCQIVFTTSDTELSEETVAVTFLTLKNTYNIQGGAPPAISWFIIPITIDIIPINLRYNTFKST